VKEEEMQKWQYRHDSLKIFDYLIRVPHKSNICTKTLPQAAVMTKKRIKFIPWVLLKLLTKMTLDFKLLQNHTKCQNSMWGKQIRLFSNAFMPTLMFIQTSSQLVSGATSSLVKRPESEADDSP
jgi:hypothetical protein